MDEQARADYKKRQKSIDKNVAGAMLLAYFAYQNRDQESIDVVNTVLRECGYPLVPNISH